MSIGKNLLASALLLAGSGVFAAQRPPEVVKTCPVVELQKESVRRYIGKVSAVNDVSLVARINGVIVKQNFESGKIVKKGDVLFELEKDTYEAALNSAKAKLAQCEAEYEFAKKHLVRQKGLREQNAVSESSYDEAVRQEATCKAAVNAAEAALRDADINLKYATIKSPITGKTGKATYSPGNYVNPSSGALINIVSVDEMYINFWITMSDYMRLFNGSFSTMQEKASVQVYLADGSLFIDGTADTDKETYEIVFIDNRVDKDTDSIRVRLLVRADGKKLLKNVKDKKEKDSYNDNIEMKIVPDALVSVKITNKENIVPAVPLSAIVSNQGMNFVYVLDKENKATMRPVVLGGTQGKLQLIVSGLVPGEVIVSDGTHKVFPGSIVKPAAAKSESK